MDGWLIPPTIGEVIELGGSRYSVAIVYKYTTSEELVLHTSGKVLGGGIVDNREEVNKITLQFESEDIYELIWIHGSEVVFNHKLHIPLRSPFTCIIGDVPPEHKSTFESRYLWKSLTDSVPIIKTIKFFGTRLNHTSSGGRKRIEHYLRHYTAHNDIFSIIPSRSIVFDRQLTPSEEILDRILNIEYTSSTRFHGLGEITFEMSYNNLHFIPLLFNTCSASSITMYTDIILIPGLSGLGYVELIELYTMIFNWISHSRLTRRLTIISHRKDMIGHRIWLVRGGITIDMIIVGSMSEMPKNAIIVENSTHFGINIIVTEIATQPHIVLYQGDQCVFVTYKPLMKRLSNMFIGCMGE